MIEAAQTTTTPAGIWALVLIGVACMGIWLAALTLAGRSEEADRKRGRLPATREGPVLGGTHVSDCRRSVAPNREAAVPTVPAQRTAAEDQPRPAHQ